MRWLRLLLMSLCAASLLATTGAHACDIWTADGLECVGDRENPTGKDRAVDKSVAHNYGCNGQSTALPRIESLPIARPLMTLPRPGDPMPLSPRDTEPASRPPAV